MRRNTTGLGNSHGIILANRHTHICVLCRKVRLFRALREINHRSTKHKAAWINPRRRNTLFAAQHDGCWFFLEVFFYVFPPKKKSSIHAHFAKWWYALFHLIIYIILDARNAMSPWEIIFLIQILWYNRNEDKEKKSLMLLGVFLSDVR